MPTSNNPDVGKLAIEVKVIPVVADADAIAAPATPIQVAGF